MRTFTFRGGIHPPAMKHLAASEAIKPLPPPDRAFIPLSQHTGMPARPLVKKRDSVKTGQKIGEAPGFISSPVHSSVSGKVSDISTHPHPVSGACETIIIDREGDDWIELEKHPGFESMKPGDILELIRENGIVGLGGACFPAAVKLSPPEHARIDTLIINGSECEPYLCSDYRLMVERPGEIIKGIRILARVLKPEKSIVAVEDNKPDAAEKLSAEAGEGIEVVLVRAKYPQGGEKQLIRAVLGREVPSGGLPLDAGVVVHNVGTAAAVKEAVIDGKPLIKRTVTVTGDNISAPANLSVRLGTPFRNLVDFCGGFKKPPGKLIAGGPMMGMAQYSLDTPVIKGTSGLVVLSGAFSREEPPLACIRCGSCVNACPAGLVPSDFARFAAREAWEAFEGSGLNDCIECGSCGYVCPAKIPIVHHIKHAKARSARVNRE